MKIKAKLDIPKSYKITSNATHENMWPTLDEVVALLIDTMDNFVVNSGEFPDPMGIMNMPITSQEKISMDSSKD